MLEQFSYTINMFVGAVVGLAAPLIAKYVEFRLENKKKLLNEQLEARKDLIERCIAQATVDPHFYKNKEFIAGTFYQIADDLSDKQLVREIEEMAEGRSRKSSKDIEQIRKKFIKELVKLKREWNLI